MKNVIVPCIKDDGASCSFKDCVVFNNCKQKFAKKKAK